MPLACHRRAPGGNTPFGIRVGVKANGSWLTLLGLGCLAEEGKGLGGRGGGGGTGPLRAHGRVRERGIERRLVPDVEDDLAHLRRPPAGVPAPLRPERAGGHPVEARLRVRADGPAGRAPGHAVAEGGACEAEPEPGPHPPAPQAQPPLGGQAAEQRQAGGPRQRLGVPGGAVQQPDPDRPVPLLGAPHDPQPREPEGLVAPPALQRAEVVRRDERRGGGLGLGLELPGGQRELRLADLRVDAEPRPVVVRVQAEVVPPGRPLQPARRAHARREGHPGGPQGGRGVGLLLPRRGAREAGARGGPQGHVPEPAGDGLGGPGLHRRLRGGVHREADGEARLVRDAEGAGGEPAHDGPRAAPAQRDAARHDAVRVLVALRDVERRQPVAEHFAGDVDVARALHAVAGLRAVDLPRGAPGVARRPELEGVLQLPAAPQGLAGVAVGHALPHGHAVQLLQPPVPARLRGRPGEGEVGHADQLVPGVPGPQLHGLCERRLLGERARDGLQAVRLPLGGRVGAAAEVHRGHLEWNVGVVEIRGRRLPSGSRDTRFPLDGAAAPISTTHTPQKLSVFLQFFFWGGGEKFLGKTPCLCRYVPDVSFV